MGQRLAVTPNSIFDRSEFDLWRAAKERQQMFWEFVALITLSGLKSSVDTIARIDTWVVDTTTFMISVSGVSMRFDSDRSSGRICCEVAPVRVELRRCILHALVPLS